MILRSLVFSTGLAFIVSFSGATVVAHELSRFTFAPSWLAHPHPTTDVFGDQDQLIAQFNDRPAPSVPYVQIPTSIIDALVATEDKTFFRNPGFDLRSVLRAGLVDIFHRDRQQGASTLTQQLIKYDYLGSEKTWKRKVEEILYAALLTREASKQTILDDYLNDVYFGNNAYGIESAVMTYFHESLSTFAAEPWTQQAAQAAFLASLPQAPSEYTTSGPNASFTLQRRNWILQQMTLLGFLTPSQEQTALAMPFMVASVVQPPQPILQVSAPDYVTYVLNEAMPLLHLSSVQAVMQSGDRIYTSFNQTVQSDIDQAYQNPNNFPPNAPDGTPVQSAAVFLNPQNGEILAMAGSRTPDSPNSFLQYNRAFQAYRQPGSSIKPILEYGAALASGRYDMWSVLFDGYGYNFGTASDPYVPQDWDGSSRGQVTMMQALTESWNVPAVWTLQQIGIPTALAYIQKLGITLNPHDGLAMALGGLTKGVTVLQMANAYQIYANGGLLETAHAITKIVAPSGEVLYENEQKPVRIVSANVAAQMRWMLRSVVTSGTGVNANTDPSQMVSGKTGTTTGDRDIWFVGFTKNYVGAIWMGFDVSSPGHVINVESYVPAALFGQIIPPLLAIHPDPAADYIEPPAATTNPAS